MSEPNAESCSHDCSSCGASCSSRTAPQDMREKPHEGTHIKKVIAIASGKGGVGKSFVTSMLAVLMNRKGYKTAVLDADITGPSVPKAFGLTEKAVGNDSGMYPVMTKNGIGVMSLNLLLEDTTDPVVWRGPVIAGAVKQFWTDVMWGDIDYMFIDMPPGTGDVPLTVFQSIPVDGIIITSSPQELVGMIVEKAVKMAGMMNIPVLGLVENMSYVECPDCGKRIEIFGKSHIDEIAKKHDVKTVCKVPVVPAIASLGDAGKVEELEGPWLDDMAAMIEKL
ncbi:MAG: Mrp/NBP35 family ATP-binding protein [Treponemataceae bacterium]|nr:Mrp/NBP35 family ATP-binding protein [Treponemataceae bacterium]